MPHPPPAPNLRRQDGERGGGARDAAASGIPLTGPLFEPMRLLIVDEEAHSRDALTELLRDEGYEVTGADSALAALDWIERLHPHVVLMALGSALLPQGSLLDAVPEQMPWVRFVVMTPFLDPDLHAGIESRGAIACALPLDLAGLVRLLHRWDAARMPRFAP